MIIEYATEKHIMSWLSMREKLWPPQQGDDFITEIQEILNDPQSTAVIAFDQHQPIAFAELSIRNYAEGCDTRHVGYLEGIFVEEGYRQRGIAQKLIQQGEAWCITMGCQEMASDAELSNSVSLHMHRAAGFTALPPVIPFVKKLLY
jgi:aminoglycoside 6'-N-acetyltransferase I